MRVAVFLAALVVAAAAVASAAAAGGPWGVLNKLGAKALEATRRQPAEEKSAFVQWNDKSLGDLAKQLGGAVEVSSAPRTHTDPAAAIARFEAAPKDFLARRGRSPLQGARKEGGPVRFLTYDGRKATSVALPREAVLKLVAGEGSGSHFAEGSELHEAHEQPSEPPARDQQNILLLEEAAGNIHNKGSPLVRVTNLAAFPSNSIVQMQYQKSSTTYSICTGTLIAPNVVLTAAHCVYDSEKETLLDISTGKMVVAWKRDGPSMASVEQTRTVTSYTVFEGYSTNPWWWEDKEAGDVALLMFGGAESPYGYLGFASNADDAWRKERMFEKTLELYKGVAKVHLTTYPGETLQGHHLYCDECRPVFSRGDAIATATCDTEGGSSGGAYWYRDTEAGYVVMAVHSSGGTSKNTAAVITTDVYDFLLLARKLSKSKFKKRASRWVSLKTMSSTSK